MLKNKKFWAYLTVVYMIFLFYVSTLPGSVKEVYKSSIRETLHNAAHVPAYSILTFLVAQWFQFTEFKERSYLFAFLVAVGYGILNEIAQIPVPGRTACVSDACLNAVGSGIALLLIKNKILKLQD